MVDAKPKTVEVEGRREDGQAHVSTNHAVSSPSFPIQMNRIDCLSRVFLRNFILDTAGRALIIMFEVCVDHHTYWTLAYFVSLAMFRLTN